MGFESDVIFLDNSKAFDKVNHGLLLKKLYFYSVKGPLYDWIKDFLMDREQIVTVDAMDNTQRLRMLQVEYPKEHFTIPLQQGLVQNLETQYSWSTHINSMVAGARKLAGWALGVFRDRTTIVMLIIWKSLNRCMFEIGILLSDVHSGIPKNWKI